MSEAGKTAPRFDISYFDGINSTVHQKLAKRTELYHAENLRSPVIGILEKRRGQSKVDAAGASMTGNYGLFRFPTTSGSQKGVFKVSAPSGTANIYALNTSNSWTILSDSDAQGISAGDFNTANVNGDLVMVNYAANNRLLAEDGTTVTTSASAGSLYNSPKASNVAFYKGRIYLADYLVGAVRYKTSVIRSSEAMGILSLVNGDYDNGGGAADWVIPVTDTKYFYTAASMNVYEVYRGGSKVATVTISSIQEATVTATNANTVFESGFTSFLSADEVWISGTYTGAKQFRWVNNSSISGRDVKQYDSFRLAGGDEDAITMAVPIANVLMFGNKNNLTTWDDYNLLSLDYGIGCVSKRGYIKLLGALYFIHYSGIYSTQGGVPKMLSRKVSRYLEGATKSGLEACAAGRKGLSVFFSIGDVTLYKKDGSTEKTLSDVCLEYSIADENWYVHTNVPSGQFETFIETTGEERLLMAHTATGKHIKEFLDKDIYTDDGDEIFSRGDTQEIQLMKEFEVYAAPISVIVETEKGASSKCFVSLDGGDFYELEGEMMKGVSTLKIHNVDKNKNSPPLCRKIRVSVRDMSKQGSRVSQVAITYLPSAMEMAQ